jgi:5,10-methylenetetrahydrofolate reductase
MKPNTTSDSRLKRRKSLRGWSVRHSRGMERLYAALLGGLTALKKAVPARVLEALEPAVVPVEKTIKGLLFDCRMCGTCVLSSTGMSCPMNCPKTLRNGPCGGVRENGHCEIVPSMKCVWLEGWSGAGRMKGGWKIEMAQDPVDQRTAGRSTWLSVVKGDHDPGGVSGGRPLDGPLPAADRRMPAVAHGRLERQLSVGRFCVTAELNPPDTADVSEILGAARPLLQLCDSVNVTDGAGGNTHISSLAVCSMLAREGFEPVMQISCRDRNRIAMQGDALGAAALGIKNILCLTGDGIQGGDQPGAKAVFDLDSTALLRTLRAMRDEGRFGSGRALGTPPAFFLGASSNPCVLPPDVEVERVAKKIRAGARFIQSQFCYDLDAFIEFFKRYRDRGLHEQCGYLVGVGPLTSAKAARWIRSNIAGIRIPDRVIDRVESARDQRQMGLDICVETIQRLREIDGVAGVHVMAFRQAGAIPEILERAGLRPQVARTA